MSDKAHSLQYLVGVYIPPDRRYSLAYNLPMPEHTQGSALFADISGFTTLTESLKNTLGPRLGAEQLASYLNQVYDTLIAEVDRYGGSVIGFSGDAITCWFDNAFLTELYRSGASTVKSSAAKQPVSDAALRAVTCACAIIEAMQRFAAIQVPGQGEFNLKVKVSVASGSTRRFLVGNPQYQLVDAAAGETLLRMASAERLASKGEIVIDEQTVALLEAQPGLQLQIDEWRISPQDGTRFAKIQGLSPKSPPAPWPPLPEGILSEEQVTPWLLPAIQERLSKGLGEFMTELRPAVALFLRFGGIDYEQDPAAGSKLDAYIRWVQSVMDRYDGTLIQLTIGEKGSYLYAVVGAPKAHEDDAGRVASAALELRTPPPELGFVSQVQIGISQGTMRTGAYGGKTRRTYGVLGDDVNLSARLMQAASPGQILVSGHVKEAIQQAFILQSMQPIQVKGKSTPVPTAALVSAARHQPEAMIYEGAFVGRQTELEQLLQATAPIFQNGQPRFAGLVYIDGEAGAGKSRLVYELRKRAVESTDTVAVAAVENTARQPANPGLDEARLQWFDCPADPILRQSLHPFKHFLRRYFKQDADVSVAENQERFDKILDDLAAKLKAPQMPQAESTLLQGVLERTRSMLGALIDLHWPGSLYEMLEPKLRFENMLAACKALILAEGLQKPVIIHIEDGHELDPDSQFFLRVLTRNASFYPFLILLSGRFCEASAQQGGEPCLPLQMDDVNIPQYVITLEELTRNELCDIAAQNLAKMLNMQSDNGSEIPRIGDDLAAFLYDKANGNPLFLEQLVTELHERNLIHLEGNQWGLTCEGIEELPASLNALLIAHLDRLEINVRATVQTASVIGREFETPVLERMLPGESQLRTVVERAWEEMIWSPIESSVDSDHYRFRQSLLRDAAYNMQPQVHLRELHNRAATAIQQIHLVDLAPYYAELAHHYSQAQDHWQAFLYARMAGEQAAAQYANSQAIDYFNKALQSAVHCDPQDTLLGRLAVNAAMGELLVTTGQYQAAAEYLNQALALAAECEDNDAQARACRWLARMHELRGEYPPAQEWIQRGLQILGKRRTNETVELLSFAGLIYSRQGDQANAQERAEQGLRIAQTLGHPDTLARVYRLLGHIARLLGNNTSAIEHFQRALGLCQQTRDVNGQAVAYNQIANACCGLSRWQEADTYFKQAGQMFEQIGDIYHRAMADNNLGWIALNQGRLDQALEHYQQGLTVTEQTGGSPWMLAGFHVNLGATYIRRGQPQAALHHLETGQQYCEQSGVRDWLPELYRHKARAALSSGDLEQAETQATQALSLARELKMRAEEGNSLRALGEIAIARSQLVEAEENLLLSLAILKEAGDEYESARSQLVLAQLYTSQGKPEAAQEALAECIPVFERLEAALDLIKAYALQQTS